MSGAPPPLRSLWFGEGLTSATTEDSGRNSDATIRAPPDVCRSHFLHTTKGSSREEAAIVQKRRCETSSSARACAAVAANPRMLLQASRTLKKRDGRAGLWPTRPSNSGTPSSRLRYSLDVPDNTLLAHRPRQHATWLMFSEHPC